MNDVVIRRWEGTIFDMVERADGPFRPRYDVAKKQGKVHNKTMKLVFLAATLASLLGVAHATRHQNMTPRKDMAEP